MSSPKKLEACAEHTLCATEDKKEDRLKQLQKAQWLRAAILGANDGLLSTALLMIGVSAAVEEQWSVILFGLAGALAGAFSMATGEFVSVSTQRDIQIAYFDKCNDINTIDRSAQASCIEAGDVSVSQTDEVIKNDNVLEEEEMEILPSPYKAAFASAASFLCGSLIPLVVAIAVTDEIGRIVAIVMVTLITLVSFGIFGAYLGGLSLKVSALRFLIGGVISMAITYNLLRPFDKNSSKNHDKD